MAEPSSRATAAQARLVFLGSPEFAIPSLTALARAFNVVAVITQPDRPAGRGWQICPPPVKVAAMELGLPVWQPEQLRGREVLAHLRALAPDCGAVVAYGEILRPSVLALAPRGFLNVHASLLPRHRGASPISAAILAGDGETGVTVMLLDAGMDTGPILAQERLPILPEDTRASLEAKLAAAGAVLLARTLPEWLAGRVEPRPQDGSLATCTRTVERGDGLIDWRCPAAHIERLSRAMQPWPGAYTYFEGKLLKVLRGQLLNAAPLAPPGTVQRQKEGVAVATGEGLLRLLSIQPEGRAVMSPEDFARGRPAFIGSLLQSPFGG